MTIHDDLLKTGELLTGAQDAPSIPPAARDLARNGGDFHGESPPPDLSSFVRGPSGGAGKREAIPPLPMDGWPEPIKRLLEEASAALGVPPELIAVPLLVFAGAVIGRSRSILPKQSWEEFPVLFAAVVAEPGGGKTPALKTAQHSLVVLQEEAFAADRAEREAAADA